MQLAIVYDSKTGKTKAAAEQMADTARAAGHDCTVSSVSDADPAAIAAADAICLGSWTKGIYVILQGPTQATLDFAGKLENLNGKPAAVFATYALALGKTLDKLAAPLTAAGANVTGKFRSKGPKAAPEFAAWLSSLGG